MRLFIAIDLPSDVRAAFTALLEELRATAPKAKWMRGENLHVTLKFLGNTDSERVRDIAAALQQVRSAQPVSLKFQGLGFFPNERRPRVFWAGMESSDNLRPLAESVDRAMHATGFALETRPFTPHLTLARFDPPGLPPNLEAAAKARASQMFGSVVAREFHLIESKLKPTGAEYTTVQSFAFVAEN